MYDKKLSTHLKLQVDPHFPVKSSDYAAGLADGVASGWEDGWKIGYDSGYEQGFEEVV